MLVSVLAVAVAISKLPRPNLLLSGNRDGGSSLFSLLTTPHRSLNCNHPRLSQRYSWLQGRQKAEGV